MDKVDILDKWIEILEKRYFDFIKNGKIKAFHQKIEDQNDI